jgi:hypothetical protein
MKNTLQLDGTPKKAFFINVYNGFTNISLRKNQSNIKIVEHSSSQSNLP